jgi:hypothetical protein
MPSDIGWARDEAANRTLKMWSAIYPELVLKFGSDPDFRRLVIAVTDLRMAMK